MMRVMTRMMMMRVMMRVSVGVRMVWCTRETRDVRASHWLLST